MATTPRHIKIRSRGEDLEEHVFEDPCEKLDTPAPWIDIKRNKKIAHERGRGFAYQKTVYTYFPIKSDQITRKYEDDLDIVNPQGSQHLHYRKNVKRIKVESGRGSRYIAAKIEYDNTEANNTRKVRIKRIGTASNYIDVERIDRYTIEHGRGFAYQGKHIYPKNQDEDLEDECPT